MNETNYGNSSDADVNNNLKPSKGSIEDAVIEAEHGQNDFQQREQGQEQKEPGVDLPRTKLLKGDLIFLRICGVVNLACAILILFDFFNAIFRCKNESCGTGMGMLMAIFPTIISSLLGGIIFINTRLKLRRLSCDDSIPIEQIKQVKQKAQVSFLMLLSPIIMFIVLMLVFALL